MFQAFVLVCAAASNLMVDYSNCMLLEDAWGPYISQENCDIRTTQMMDETLNSEMNYYITYMLGYPDLLYVEGHCTLINDDSI